MSLDKQKHGWEGLNNGGEIYDNQNVGSMNPNRIRACLNLIKKALMVSMEPTPDAAERAKEILQLVYTEYSDVLNEDLGQSPQIISAGDEIAKLMDGIDSGNNRKQ